MFRVWGRTFKSNKMLQSTTIELEINDTRTHKIFKALEMICDEFDLSNPIWLDTNITNLSAYHEPVSIPTVSWNQ